MNLQGKIIAVLPLREGESSRGKWQSQDYVIETQEEYPHKMLFTVVGEDRINRFRIQQGQMVYVEFDIDAREYNGKWFNSIRAFDVRLREPVQVPTSEPAPQPNVVYAKDVAKEEPTDDLPF